MALWKVMEFESSLVWPGRNKNKYFYNYFNFPKVKDNAKVLLGLCYKPQHYNAQHKGTKFSADCAYDK